MRKRVYVWWRNLRFNLGFWIGDFTDAERDPNE